MILFEQNSSILIHFRIINQLFIQKSLSLSLPVLLFLSMYFHEFYLIQHYILPLPYSSLSPSVLLTTKWVPNMSIEHPISTREKPLE